MQASVAVTHPLSETSSNGSSLYAVGHLSDAALLAGTRGLVARSNQQLARLLAHLAEVEARGIHRARACSSLCAYCVYELRMSEDTAFRTARAAKLGRQFPVVFEQIAAGELHLTGLLLLGPHLTEENHREVLRLAKHRSKREIIKLVRRIDPLPDVPSRIEPLGPAGAGQPLPNATWSAFMQALNPVRELAPSERPSTWLDLGAQAVPEVLMPEALMPETPTSTANSADQSADQVEVGPNDLNHGDGATSPLHPQRFAVQFTATQEYVDLVERARDLLSHAVPRRDLAEVHLRAMRALVDQLEKRRFGAGASATKAASGTAEASATEATEASAAHRDTDDRAADPSLRARLEVEKATEAPRRHGEAASAATEKPSGRYIALHVRREVARRDAGRCAYVAADGRRCRETSFLELHHHDPYAHGGAARVDNLSLYCRTHNALAAERDFGRDYIARRSGRE